MKENTVNWDTISRRLERAAERVPAPATDARLDLDVFSADEIRTMEAIAARYPAGTVGRGGGLSALSDDDLADLTHIAERVRASREEAPIETA